MPCYEARVPDNSPPMRLDAYLARALPALPAHVLRGAFARRDVKMDGVRTRPEALAAQGALVQVYTAYQPQLDVVYEDGHILLINKPAGISVEEDGRGGMTLLSLAALYAREAYIPRLCHRLDNPTSGLLLLAKDDAAEQAALSAFKAHSMQKTYTCIVRGVMRPAENTCEAYLVKDAARAKVKIVSHNTPGSKPIITRYQTLHCDGETSRLRVDLLTGRTHQIRAHMAYLAHPVLGDDQYGDRAFNKRMKAGRLMLCATGLTLHADGVLQYLEGRHFEAAPPF